ncbi:MAG: sugar phosphate isomerase/epimerase [Clostridia bacterium]|nr:sugar phosphate isomerase/epimerase [Clostridia bacterium]
MKPFQIGIQLYSVRDDLAADFEGTLRAVKGMGYDYVEFAGYYGGKSGEELKALLDEIGLKSISVHQGIATFLNDGQASFDFFKAYGVEYIVIPWFDKNKLVGTSAWEGTKASFLKVAKQAHKNGMKVLYHNHDFEFEKVGDRYIYDIMFEELKGYVDPQPDTCWLNYGGVNPAEYIRKYGDRINIVHLKDFVCTKLAAGPVYELIGQNRNSVDKGSQEDTGFRLVPLGQGRNDFAAILDACDAIDVDLVIVEQDNFIGMTPMEGMKASRTYLKDTFNL